MPYRKFKKRGHLCLEPKVSIKKRGGIAFNRYAGETFNLNKYKYAELFYDEEKEIMGVKPTHFKSKDQYSLFAVNGEIRISCKLFFDYNNISYNETHRRDVKYDDITGMILISMKDNKKFRQE